MGLMLKKINMDHQLMINTSQKVAQDQISLLSLFQAVMLMLEASIYQKKPVVGTSQRNIGPSRVPKADSLKKGPSRVPRKLTSNITKQDKTKTASQIIARNKSNVKTEVNPKVSGKKTVAKNVCQSKPTVTTFKKPSVIKEEK